jgi:hypothetical protein
MKPTIFRGAVGGLAGLVGLFLAGPTYASTLKQDLRIPSQLPQLVVLSAERDPAAVARPRMAQVAATDKQRQSLSVVDSATPAEIAGRSLNPGASDPDVPLPHPGLSGEFSQRTDVAKPLAGPTPFGRGESGGGVLGFRLPLPAQRGPAGQSTTSSSP